MKKNILTFSLIAIAAVLLAFTILDSNKDKAILEVLSYSLNNGHYSPKEINDEFSKNVFNYYLKRNDYSKRFLLQEDIDKLKDYELDIDDEINSTSFDFFNLSNEILSERIKEVEAYYIDILAKPFDFEVNEEYESDPEKRKFAKDKVELKDFWRKYLKYSTLVKLSNMLTIQEDAIEQKDTSLKIKSFSELEESARKKVLKTHTDWFRRLSKLNKKDRFNTYLNSITGIYDPHTSYLPPKDKENFDIRMSGRLEGIGATLTESEGYIKIVSIVPGSPSSKIEEITVNTLILKVAQGDKEPVDIVDMRLDNAVKLIRGKKGTEVKLTIKKVDGTITVVSIIRDVINIEATYAKSAIIKDKKQKHSFGYIYLPAFYADFNKRNGRFSAKDIFLEIEKLKAENVEGLILDLRNNGGGSLSDAVEMSGFFIEDGPIVQVKAKIGKPRIWNDTDSRTQWDGTIVVMVNSLSASASEILAAALQDYGRAIIVGSPTFGKGTVQQVFNLDNSVQGNNGDIKPLGHVKLTIQKFYRINGGSTQLRGVTPDIELPDTYKYIDMGEKDQDFPMAWSEIKAVEYENYNRITNLNKLRQKSKARVGKNSEFNLIIEKAEWIKTQKDKSISSLNFNKYKLEDKELDAINKKFKSIGENTTNLHFSAVKKEQALMEKDSLKTKRVKAWHKRLQNDVYIEECISILKDLK